MFIAFSIKKNLLWKANSWWTVKKLHYHVHRSPPLDSWVSWIQPTHWHPILWGYVLILPYHLRLGPSGSFLQIFISECYLSLFLSFQFFSQSSSRFIIFILWLFSYLVKSTNHQSAYHTPSAMGTTVCYRHLMMIDRCYVIMRKSSDSIFNKFSEFTRQWGTHTQDFSSVQHALDRRVDVITLLSLS
jgi:hypothetical protein